jgi:hypothetical protein
VAAPGKRAGDDKQSLPVSFGGPAELGHVVARKATLTDFVSVHLQYGTGFAASQIVSVKTCSPGGHKSIAPAPTAEGPTEALASRARAPVRIVMGPGNVDRDRQARPGRRVLLTAT